MGTNSTHSHNPHNVVQLDLVRKENKGNVIPQPARGCSLGTSGSFCLLCFCNYSFISVKNILSIVSPHPWARKSFPFHDFSL